VSVLNDEEGGEGWWTRRDASILNLGPDFGNGSARGNDGHSFPRVYGPRRAISRLSKGFNLDLKHQVFGEGWNIYSKTAVSAMSARTSARLKARQTHSRQTGWETLAAPSSEHLKNTKPPPKRQKTTTANTKTKAVTKRGKGKNKKTQETFLIELPLDVLFEIFKSLQPLDLLNLSYTAQELRSILTAEYAASIWKKVLYMSF
jgi:hypothetical protein